MPPPAHGAPARPPQIPAARDVTGRGGGREGGGGGGVGADGGREPPSGSAPPAIPVPNGDPDPKK